MKKEQAKPQAGDFWGGLAAMLLVLPAALAFGVTVFAPLGPDYAAQGAFAGMLGAAVLGLLAALLGGTQGLISAPCAPAAAVLAALTLERMQLGHEPLVILLQLTLIGMLAGLFQVLFGLLRWGRLIKYMPYPVVSGYLSGVGLLIIFSQLPKFLGLKAGDLKSVLFQPLIWHWQSLLVGSITVMTMLWASRLIRMIPPVILALISGLVSYQILAALDPALRRLQGNPLIVGLPPLTEGNGLQSLWLRWQAFQMPGPEFLQTVLVPALTLAVLLSIDTLKTCLILDALTRRRHDSNRELLGQGLGNFLTALLARISHKQISR
ncbi:MAG: SulP family inorganic anion transporter [Candidatus Sericytochromatia bacterium]|nr:SulP family inorganic anion transporter [Candidatus Sericytochromatia bacterium]